MGNLAVSFSALSDPLLLRCLLGFGGGGWLQGRAPWLHPSLQGMRCIPLPACFVLRPCERERPHGSGSIGVMLVLFLCSQATAKLARINYCRSGVEILINTANWSIFLSNRRYL